MDLLHYLFGLSLLSNCKHLASVTLFLLSLLLTYLQSFTLTVIPIIIDVISFSFFLFFSCVDCQNSDDTRPRLKLMHTILTI